MIRQRILTAESRQKSYSDNRRRDLEFEVGDKVFLKVLPRKRMIRQGKWGKLCPRYVGPFEVLQRVGQVAYRSAHFLVMNVKNPLPKLAKLYIEEIVRLHGVPASIVSDRDPRCVSRYWQ